MKERKVCHYVLWMVPIILLISSTSIQAKVNNIFTKVQRVLCVFFCCSRCYCFFLFFCLYGKECISKQEEELYSVTMFLSSFLWKILWQSEKNKSIINIFMDAWVCGAIQHFNPYLYQWYTSKLKISCLKSKQRRLLLSLTFSFCFEVWIRNFGENK